MQISWQILIWFLVFYLTPVYEWVTNVPIVSFDNDWENICCYIDFFPLLPEEPLQTEMTEGQSYSG